MCIPIYIYYYQRVTLMFCVKILSKKRFSMLNSAVKVKEIAQYTVDVLERNRESETKREKVPSILK